MPGHLQLENIENAVPAAMKHFTKLKWTDLAYELPNYPALNTITKRHKDNLVGGSGIQAHFKVFKSGIAKNVGILEPQTITFKDMFRKGDVPWRHNWTAWGWDLRELSMLRGPSEIVDYAKARRIEALQSLAELWEQTFWNKPADSTDDETPFGIAYWITYDDSNFVQGFTSGDPSGFASGAAGLASATYPHWQNYVGPYEAVTKDDLVETLAAAQYECNFMPMVPLPDQDQYNGANHQMFTNFVTWRGLKRLAEEQNDSIGVDLDPYKNPIMNGIPLTPVPYFDAGRDFCSDIAARNPIYGVNWNTFSVKFLEGWYMKEIGPRDLDKQPAAQGYHLYCSWNSFCINRRRQFVCLKAA